jgi:hypothetical protein
MKKVVRTISFPKAAKETIEFFVSNQYAQVYAKLFKKEQVICGFQKRNDNVDDTTNQTRVITKEFLFESDSEAEGFFTGSVDAEFSQLRAQYSSLLQSNGIAFEEVLV